MKFQISRVSSSFDDSERPCDGSYVEERTHQFPNGYISKRICWFVDVGTLEELIALAENAGRELIVGSKPDNLWAEEPSIRIYDERDE